MQIRELFAHPDGHISGTYRVTASEQRVSRSGIPYLSLRLSDYSGTLRAQGWPDQYHGPANPADMTLCTATGKLRTLHDRKFLDLQRLEPVSSMPADPVLLFPAESTPIIGGIERLREIRDRITVAPLRRFVNAVLANDVLALPFLRLPASRNHHHSFPGGLLTHSQECAEIVANLGIPLPRDILELGMVAALWHDIGKVRTLDTRKGAWLAGALLNHDALTLELLAPALAELDREWQEGALLLRYLLTWNKCGHYVRPVQVIAEAVAAADRISSGLSAEQLAFAGAEEWRKLAKWHGSQYLRLNAA